jgi:outer membrane receptor protein involved in Fe transport
MFTPLGTLLLFLHVSSPDATAAPAPDAQAAPSPPPDGSLPVPEEAADPTGPVASPAPPDPISPAGPAQLLGTVSDRKTGVPVEGVLVLVDAENVATTDAAGRFTAAGLTPGPHLISLAGPQGEELSQELTVSAGATVRRQFQLESAEVAAVTVVQKAERPKREAGEVVLSHEELASVPGTFGDPVRVIENLPGTSRAPGGAGGALIVRGANPADSAVLLDGVHIPLLYHFGGLTSIVNAAFISDVTFMPGGFGAQYGRATAGVAAVQTAPLTCDRVRGSASVDVLDAELFACVPIGQWRLAAAGRRSYIDAFLPALLQSGAEEGKSPTIVSPSYFDYQAKAETARARQRFELFAFGSRDSLRVTRAASAEDADYELGGTISFHRLQARHVYLGERLQLESSLVPGFLRQEVRDGSGDVGSAHHSGIDMYTVQWRETASLRLGERLTLRGGFDHELHHWRADFITDLPSGTRQYPTPVVFDNRVQNLWKARGTGLDQAYWGELAIRVGERLVLTPGARVANLVFDQTQRFVIEPRVAARWQAAEDTALTGAAGIYRKLPDLFSGVLVHDFGQPRLAAERALHLVGGVERRWGRFDAKLDGFYVRRDQLPSPTNELEVRDGKAQPVLFRSDGRGRSYGVEVMLRLTPEEDHRFSGWVAYTLSRSLRIDRTVAGEGLGQYASNDVATPRLAELPTVSQEHLSPFDQTHLLTAVGRWELPWRMSLGFRFQLVSGNPTTPLERGQTFYDADADRYQVRPETVARGSERLPTFHRIDLRLDKTWQFARWRLTAYLEVMNAYNQRPVEAFGYDFRYRTRTELRGLPVLPLLGVKGEI